MDEVLLHIYVTENSLECDRKIKSILQASLRVIPDVNYVTKDEIVVFQKKNIGRKAVKFFDRRLKMK